MCCYLCGEAGRSRPLNFWGSVCIFCGGCILTGS